MILIAHPNCTTCKKAKAWLDSRGFSYEFRDIREQNPTAGELDSWQEKSGIALKKFFNTSGRVYQSMNLKDRLPELSREEQLCLLASDGMLVKRPLLIDGERILVGFRESEWQEKLQ